MAEITSEIFDAPECKFKFLENNGFNIPNYFVVDTTDEILKLYNDYAINEREKLNYDIDGLVEEINNYEIQEEMGYDSEGLNPKFAKGIKFDSMGNTTKLLSVDYNTGASGKITPVANFEPVFVLDATLEFATLHNIEILETFIAKGLKIGSTIHVIKANDIIPQIVDVVETSDDLENIEILTKCPACGTTLERESCDLVCNNDSCAAKSKGVLLNYFNTLGIKDGAGEKFVDKAIKELKISSIKEMLELSVNDLLTLSGFGDKKAQLTYDAIHSVKTVTQSQFIALLNITSIGERFAKNVLMGLPFDKLITLDFSKEEFIAIKGLQEKTYKTFCEGIEINLENGVIADMLDVLTVIEPVIVEKIENSFCDGNSFCITGKLTSISRDALETHIKDRGGKISAANKNLNYLITNETVAKSSKYKKVIALNDAGLNIKVINETDILKALEI